jgi:hypothetical protein
MTWATGRPAGRAQLAAAMTDYAVLAVVEHGHHDLPWRAELAEVIPRHSRSPGYASPGFSLPDALPAEGLLEITGRATTAPVSFRQPVAPYAVGGVLEMAVVARTWPGGGRRRRPRSYGRRARRMVGGSMSP